ncbi:deoxyguanosinetriphosphate triphosphohydrolase [Wolbachia endosymbiont of Litomosoides brasiliensis]|uniref:deoxyguanosinetriphosphate triphosphohydrolase n=1 Tax=Wolbachia endosymbiont of Litomosoides brasiliensis TaxID=1812117 RepID=UPI00158DF28A|nr:deoxyguanosinetriphosphate triphosphohydrolase [Wolbachia endosymbiont of Litomosoides brasiliensis]NUY39819.1 deoxyguanosinetriphosphate triphosphohydrolase [Wolbachia endosymbiont of Litomosoides brasiliensis]
MSNNNFLLSYACFPNKTRGRYFKEKEDENRSCFQRDRDRIVHSNAFRKLEYKTQVFINYEHDYYRTRLTHSLEVAQIARSIARRLGLDEDITECIALAHDLGHSPFGHTGENALKRAIQDLNLDNEKYEFDHNVQAIRILTYLEQKHADFDGMNLSWEVVEGVAKHNGPLLGQNAVSYTNNQLLLEYNEKYNLKLEEFSSIEAQVASIADDIAYSVHDLDDALRANLVIIEDLFNVPLIGRTFKDIKSGYLELPQSKLIHESLSRIIGIMISDVVSQTEKNIEDYKIKSVEDVRGLDKMLVTFSPEIANATKEIKKFNMEKIYRSYKLNRTMNKAKRIVKELFHCFYENPWLLPAEWSKLAHQFQRSVVICDYISGMTDRFAIHEHRRIFDTSYEMTSF